MMWEGQGGKLSQRPLVTKEAPERPQRRDFMACRGSVWGRVTVTKGNHKQTGLHPAHLATWRRLPAGISSLSQSQRVGR